MRFLWRQYKQHIYCFCSDRALEGLRGSFVTLSFWYKRCLSGDNDGCEKKSPQQTFKAFFKNNDQIFCLFFVVLHLEKLVKSFFCCYPILWVFVWDVNKGSGIGRGGASRRPHNVACSRHFACLKRKKSRSPSGTSGATLSWSRNRQKDPQEIKKYGQTHRTNDLVRVSDGLLVQPRLDELAAGLQRDEVIRMRGNLQELR